MLRGAIILCGGQSTRMGRDKASLPFGPAETMLGRVVRIVSAAVPSERIICVAAPDQQLPALRADVRTIRDVQPNQGPLAGLAAGIEFLADDVEAIFATGCDTPLLVPQFITRMFDLLGDHQIAAPHDGLRWHPLAAVYRTSVLSRVEALLAECRRSLVALLEAADTRRVPVKEFMDVDPQRTSLFACNAPEEYRSALLAAGFGK